MRRTVFVGGCFDVLHVGHIKLLRKARALGDWLIVGVNTDESVRALKGEDRPVNTFFDRVEMLNAVRYIDRVHVIPELDHCKLIQWLRPNILVMGDEPVKRECKEVQLARSMGIEVVFIPLVDGVSTTEILKKGGSR